MSALVFCLLLPNLFWSGPPGAANVLQQAGISAIAVPPSAFNSWKDVKGLAIRPVDPTKLTKIPTPGVNFRAEYASATREPWVDSNGWRFLRSPASLFYCHAPGKAAALAAAEAYAYGTQVFIQTDDTGLKPFAAMLHFLSALPDAQLPSLTNINYQDDGSPASGEFMNLLVRSNLLFKTVQTANDQSGLPVVFGSAQYPKSEGGNPKLLAEKARANLTDAKRLLRIYGSSVVVGRLVGNASHLRVFLLNYGTVHADVSGIRIRVLGNYSKSHVTQYDCPDTNLRDYSSGSGATEFTIADLHMFAVIDLTR